MTEKYEHEETMSIVESLEAIAYRLESWSKYELHCKAKSIEVDQSCNAENYSQMSGRIMKTVEHLKKIGKQLI